MDSEQNNHVTEASDTGHSHKLLAFLEAFTVIGSAFGPAFVRSDHGRELLAAGQTALAVELGILTHTQQ